MPMTANERKRRQLEREERRLKALPDSSYVFLRTPFHEHLGRDPNWSSVELMFDLMGIEPPAFEDDLGPEHFAAPGSLDPDQDPLEAFENAEGSIGRAEMMVVHLIDAAVELASIINRYKLSELQARRQEFESSDLSDPVERRTALEAVTQLSKIEDELQKNVRRTFPQWRVKGI